MPHPPTRRRLLALLLGLLVLAAACGGADDGADDGEGAADAAATDAGDDAAAAGGATDDAAGADGAATEGGGDEAPAEDLGTLRVGMICGGMTPMAAMMAINADTFPEGLEIEKICFDGGSEAVQALIGGSLDIFTGSLEHVISTQAQGLPTRTYAVINTRAPYELVAPGDSDVASVADLAGEQVGVTSPGSLSDTELIIAAEENGITYEDMTVVGVGSGATMAAALESGSIAAGMVSDPQLSELLEQGYQLVWEPEFDYVAITVIANSDRVADREDAFRAFMQGLDTAAQEARADIQWAIDAMAEEGFQVSDEALAAAVENNLGNIPEDLAVDEAAYQGTLDLLEQADRLSEDAPAFEDAVDFSLLPG